MRGLPSHFLISIQLLFWGSVALPSDLSPLELHGRFLDLVNQGKPVRPLALE